MTNTATHTQTPRSLRYREPRTGWIYTVENGQVLTWSELAGKWMTSSSTPEWVRANCE